MPSSKSGVKDFALAIWSDWLTLLSGPWSVPAAVAAYWVSNETGKIVLGLTAFCCLVFSAYRLWKREHDKVVERDQRKRQLLDDIAALREKVGNYRIEMETDHDAGRFNQNDWEKKYTALEVEIASKIEQLSSKAEATTYRHRGNLQRAINTNIGPNMGGFRWPVLVDISIRDLDYLQTFIHAHSRGKERTV
jgi:hypothetical protein